jgi:hypothetical protein
MAAYFWGLISIYESILFDVIAPICMLTSEMIVNTLAGLVSLVIFLFDRAVNTMESSLAIVSYSLFVITYLLLLRIEIGILCDVASDLPASDESRNECIFCRVNVRRYAAVPCGHLLYCGECNANSEIDRSKCLLCRKTPEAYMEVFV